MCGAFILASCADDNDSNPVLQKPTSFVLNTPALATNGTYDLANSTSVELTCTQPNYGFPITTNYRSSDQGRYVKRYEDEHEFQNCKD